MLTCLTSMAQLPELKTVNGRTQLYVDGQPFYALGGELHNSTTGSVPHMRHVWKRMADKNLNTVIAPVTWELLEPVEGQFDYSIIDAMIQGCQENHLKLVVLWFGSWKNSNSTYVPAWVKKDTKRFPHITDLDGQDLNTLTTLSPASVKADVNAYTHLMQHIKEVDTQHTVITMQVENEIGTLDMMTTFTGKPNRSYRDGSPEAQKAFHSAVPAQLISYLKKHKKTLHPAIAAAWKAHGEKEKGTWEEVFGPSQEDQNPDFNTHYSWLTDEIFNAWNYACYVEQIAAAGKNILNLPHYVNAWMKTPGQRDPGCYPSGGPQAHLLDIWRAGAPHIDFIAPDIYEVGIFDKICTDFQRNGNPLFIPETRVDLAAAARAFYAYGRYGALCYAPFGIDGNGLMNTADDNESAFQAVYGILKQLMPFLQQYAGTSKCTGFYLDGDKKTDMAQLGDVTLMARYINTDEALALFGTRIAGGAQQNIPTGFIVFQTAPDEYIVAGGIGGGAVSFIKDGKAVNLISVDEICTDTDGSTYYHRHNGDETSYGGPSVKAGQIKIFRVKL